MRCAHVYERAAPRAGRTVAMLDRIVLDDEAPLPGELRLLMAALDTLVVLFRTGEG